MLRDLLCSDSERPVLLRNKCCTEASVVQTSQPACHHRANDSTAWFMVGICLRVQPTSGRCQPNVVTGRQNQKCQLCCREAKIFLVFIFYIPVSGCVFELSSPQELVWERRYTRKDL